MNEYMFYHSELSLSCETWFKPSRQWRRQDLLRGGAKLEIRLSGTHGELQGRRQ